MKTVIKKQKGVALFITLLVVTIATLLATEIWFNNNLDISRQYNNRAFYQANHYAKGMFLWANDILKKDYEEDAQFDNHSEIWNQPLVGIETEDAILSGKLTNLDSKFNLNNLIIAGIVDEVQLAYFKRILLLLELSPDIANKILDWLDNDSIPRPSGAEDVTYLSKSPSYRTSGQYFLHISELKLIDGINENIYQQLKRHVSVLEVIGNRATRLNINTASVLLLRALDVRLTAKDAINLYSDGNATNKTIADFFEQPVLQSIGLNPQQRIDLKLLISTNSKWFQAKINVTMEQSVFQKYALVYRQGTNSLVKQWSDGAFN